MSHELIRRETSYSQMPMPARIRYAETIAGAADLVPRGLFDNATGRPSPAKLFLVFETGSMLGLEPMAALQGIDVIEGTATLAPRLVLALIRAAGYRVVESEHGSVRADGPDYGWTIEVYDDEADPSTPLATSTFTLDDAEVAELCSLEQRDDGRWRTVAVSKQGKPLPWQLYPSDLVYWRAVSRVGRRGFSHVTLGIAYVPEELTTGELGENGMRVLTTSDTQKLLDELAELDDRAALSAWWREHHADDAATKEVRAALDAKLLTVTKDSRDVVPVGAPGNTGIAELDARHDDEPTPEAEAEHDAEVEQAIADHEAALPADDEGPLVAQDSDEQARIASAELAEGEKIGDDPKWKGAPCSVCGARHATARHYDAAGADA